VSPAAGTSGPWLRADIRVLARLYLGDLLPSEAADAEALFVDDPQTLLLADRLFPRREPYVAPLDQF
jgi:predicted acetyltransferase